MINCPKEKNIFDVSGDEYRKLSNIHQKNNRLDRIDYNTVPNILKRLANLQTTKVLQFPTL